MSREAMLLAEIGFARNLILAEQWKAAQDILAGLAPPDDAGLRGELALLWRSLGRGYFSGQAMQSAALAFEKALELSPGDASINLDLGFTLFNLGRYKAAQMAFQSIADDAPESPAALRALATMALVGSDFRSLEGILRRVIESDPSDAEAWSLRVQAAYNRLDVGRRYRDWTRQNIADPKARPDLLGLDAAQWQELRQALDAARRLNPRIRVDEIGFRLLTAAGRPEQALEFLSADPLPDARTHQWMADAWWLLRDRRAAKDYLRRSLEERAGQVAAPRPLAQDIQSAAPVAQGLARRDLEARGKTPVVWLHWDAPDHLSRSIASVIAASPASPLVILGDASNAIAPCAHEPMTRYAASAWEFLERYEHASENDFVYEAFCFMRWFILKDWMRDAGIAQAVAIDSDILLFADIEREIMPRLNAMPLAFTGPLGPHFSILSLPGLEELCAFFMSAYEHGAPDAGAQVTDMTLLPRFLAGRDWADLSQTIDGARIDGNIRLSEGLRMAGGAKEIRFREGRAFGKRVEDSADLRLLALHFQGTAKPLMQQALLRRDLTA